MKHTKKFNENVEKAIYKASQKHGLPLEFMRSMAEIESAGDEKVINNLGYAGLYQFGKTTAIEMGLNPNDRLDAEKNADAAARYTLQNLKYLKSQGFDIDIKKNPEIAYLAHQQGAGGISQILKSARDGFDVSASIRRNMNTNGGKGKSTKEFLDYWASEYKKRTEKLALIDDVKEDDEIKDVLF